MEPTAHQPYHRNWDWQHEASNATGWHWLPDWATFYLDLGASVVQKMSKSEERFTMVLTVPTDGFAAALTTTGIVIESWAVSTLRSPEQHVEYLKSLAMNTTVNYQPPRQDKVVQGQLMGFEGGAFILDVYKKGATYQRRTIPESLAQQISVAQTQKDQPPKRALLRSKATQQGLASLIPESVGFSVTETRKYGCTLVSRLSKLTKEVMEITMAMVSETALAIGPLQDVIKLDEFLERKTVELYSTKFWSADSRQSPINQESPIVIFDGGRSFLNHNDNWTGSNRLIIANRREAAFTDFINEINNELAYGKQEITLETYSPTPIGVEIVGYIHE